MAPAPLKKWLLLVDDESSFREELRAFIELNYRDEVKIVEAADGVEATNRLPFQAFDVIIADVNMPRKGGIAFIKSVRESQLNATTPVIVVTGYPDTEIKGDFITLKEKPVELPEISELIKTQLKLGRNSNRISAGLLNTMIECSSKFIVQSLKSVPEQERPHGKPPGEDLKGDFTIEVEVKSGTVKNVFALSFDEELLSGLSTMIQKSNSQGPEICAKVASDIIVKHAINMLGATEVSVSDKHLLKPDDPELKTLRKMRGIEVPLSSDRGNLYLYALWQSVR